MVLGSALVVLQQRVGVAQAVASLGFHRLVPELPRQLQRLPVQKGRISPWRGWQCPFLLRNTYLHMANALNSQRQTHVGARVPVG